MGGDLRGGGKEGEGWSHTNHLARFSGSSSEKGWGGGIQGRVDPPPPVEDWGGGVVVGSGRGVSTGKWHIFFRSYHIKMFNDRLRLGIIIFQSNIGIIVNVDQ